jgi:hypothetical protein
MDNNSKTDLEKLDFQFTSKPLLVGGKAMEYYNLRPAGKDIDFIITHADYDRLAQQYPDNLKEIWGDLGVCVYEFEIWQTICLFDYAFLSAGAIDAGEYLVISLEKLLFLKALGMEIPKYHADLEMLVKRILKIQYETYYHK